MQFWLMHGVATSSVRGARTCLATNEICFLVVSAYVKCATMTVTVDAILMHGVASSVRARTSIMRFISSLGLFFILNMKTPPGYFYFLI